MADDADALLKGMLGIKNVVEGTKRDRCVGNFFRLLGCAEGWIGGRERGRKRGQGEIRCVSYRIRVARKPPMTVSIDQINRQSVVTLISCVLQQALKC